MKKSEVIKYLKSNQDPRGIAHWEKQENKPEGLKSVGIGLTRLRKYAKTIGRDAKLAQQLWKTNLYEAKIISLLIDDPKTMTVEQAEAQVEELEGGYLAHVFSTCGATIAKTAFVVELMETWVKSSDPVRRGCGYGLLYEIAKSKKKSGPSDEDFLAQVKRIERSHKKQPMSVLLSMGTALMGIGMRTKKLNRAALKVADQIGPIDFDPDGRCDPFDVPSKLRGDYAKQKLGL